MNKRKSKPEKIHDNHLNDIVLRLERSGLYSSIMQNVTYINQITKECGEIDVLAFGKNPRNILLFEYKTSDKTGRYNKAVNQLNRGEEYIRSIMQDARIFKFYVCEDNYYKRVN
jgi:hypothetical protein